MPYNTIFPLFLLSLGFPALLPAGAATVLYVKPTKDTPCPSEPCHTLDEYAQYTSQYFSGTTIEFLPGTHNLSKPLHISGIHNLSLLGRNVTRNETVICISRAEAFHFTYHGTNKSDPMYQMMLLLTLPPIGSISAKHRGGNVMMVATGKNETRPMAGNVNVSHMLLTLPPLGSTSAKHRGGNVTMVATEKNETRPMAGDVNVSHNQCATDSPSGGACGCPPGLSLSLGDPEYCLKCSNIYLVLIIPFALAGLALVFFIKVLNLTVAEGTINGLIFYANIVQANQAVFFPAGETSPLNVFIAWLNLDLGITTCFFDGLDAYWKTWLQFVFPLYLWAIITLIIYLSHKFQAVAKIMGNNSVPVLATLILLSYSKLLYTIISALSLSFLKVSENSTVAVWSFDQNIEYLSGKHIPLFLAAVVVLLFLWLPYTALLLFEQSIQKIGNYRIRKWMLRLKPFLDAYFGPLKSEHRYWFGILLIARALLLLVFCFTNNPNVNLLATITVAVLLLVHLPYDTHMTVHPNGASKCIRFWGGSYYRKPYLSLLETSFLLNLVMLAAGSWYVLKTESSQRAVVYIFVGITFCQFIGIIILHGYSQLKKWWSERKQNLQQVNRADYETIPDQSSGLKTDQWTQYHPMNQCREPLLEDEDN